MNEERINRIADDIEDDRDLHIQAGLTFSGYDEEGLPEYIGTKEQWEEYEKLYLESLNN